MTVAEQITPTVAFWEWQKDAACQDHSEDLFYHCEAERKGLRREKEQIAKQICASCPVLEQCRDYALTVGEQYGVWGGLSEMERYRLTGTTRHG